MTMERIRLPRNKELELAFTGRLIGQAETEVGNKGTEVKIYQSMGGKYVVFVCQWRDDWQWDTNRVGVCNNAREVVVWLHGDARGPLGETSIMAIEDAAKEDDAFEKHVIRPDEIK